MAHLGVYPPHGRVRVAARLSVDDEAVRLAVITKMAWIKRQQRKFREQARQTVREYISGESHYFLGHRYLLRVIEEDASPRVTIPNKRHIRLYVRSGSDITQRERVFLAWYRTELKALIPRYWKNGNPLLKLRQPSGVCAK